MCGQLGLLQMTFGTPCPRPGPVFSLVPEARWSCVVTAALSQLQQHRAGRSSAETALACRLEQGVQPGRVSFFLTLAVQVYPDQRVSPEVRTCLALPLPTPLAQDPALRPTRVCRHFWPSDMEVFLAMTVFVALKRIKKLEPSF